MFLPNFGKAMEKFFQLDALLSRALQPHVAPRYGVQQFCKKRVGVMSSAGDKEMMEAIDHAASVQIVVVHHLVQCSHRPFEDAGVLLPTFFPFPIVYTSTQCFFEDQLNLSPAAVGHQELDVFSVIKERTLSEKLKGKDGFAKVAIGHVSNVAQDPHRWVQQFQLTDGLKALLNHQPRK